MAELVDAADSKSAIRKDVGVRVSPRAPHLRCDFMKKDAKQNFLETSVVVLGCGLVGALAANFFKKLNIPFVLIDPQSPQKMIDAVVDGRTTAISYGSYLIFKECGLWSGELEEHAEPIESIHVLEKNCISVLDFDASELGDHPMGYIVENQYIRKSLLSNLQNDDHCFFNTAIEDLSKNDQGVFAKLSNGMEIKANLLVSAEGRNSPSRNLIGPKKTMKDYAQKALVVHLEHEKSHQNRAWEVFSSDGPFAILPLKDEQKKKSGIVFAKHITFDWDKLSDDDLVKEIQTFFPYYGALKVCSKRWFFPLSVFELDRLVGQRQVLIGDAAHAMHPLAGQGVNLGWRDVKVLVDMLQKLHKLGLDIGQDTYLKDYEAKRMRDIKQLVKATDLLNGLFQHPSKLLSYARNFGLTAVNQMGPLKKFFMKKAMGL